MNWFQVVASFFVGFVAGQASMLAILYMVSAMIDRQHQAERAIPADAIKS